MLARRPDSRPGSPGRTSIHLWERASSLPQFFPGCSQASQSPQIPCGSELARDGGGSACGDVLWFGQTQGLDGGGPVELVCTAWCFQLQLMSFHVGIGHWRPGASAVGAQAPGQACQVFRMTAKGGADRVVLTRRQLADERIDACLLRDLVQQRPQGLVDQMCSTALDPLPPTWLGRWVSHAASKVSAFSQNCA